MCLIDNALILRAVEQSTCHKRITVAAIYDDKRNVLSVQSNRCDPPDGICQRLGVVNTKENYPVESCNWTHAERRAIEALPEWMLKSEYYKPHRLDLYGHDFLCNDCENLARSIGITEFNIIPGNKFGTGERGIDKTASDLVQSKASEVRS